MQVKYCTGFFAIICMQKLYASHLPFDTMPSWLKRGTNLRNGNLMFNLNCGELNLSKLFLLFFSFKLDNIKDRLRKACIKTNQAVSIRAPQYEKNTMLNTSMILALYVLLNLNK